MNEQVPSKDQLYYLQVRGFSGNSLIWWRKGRCGYTADIQQAHVFTKEEAFAQQRCRPDEDSPWRKDYIDSILQHHVHCEKVDRDAEAAFVATPEPPAEAVCEWCGGTKDQHDDPSTFRPRAAPPPASALRTQLDVLAAHMEQHGYGRPAIVKEVQAALDVMQLMKADECSGSTKEARHD